MFWNKKEDKNKLPDLPALSASLRNNPKLHASPDAFNLEEFPGDQGHSLPSLPDSPTENGFSQSAIKSAVTDDKKTKIQDDEFDDLPELPEKQEMEEDPKSGLKEINTDIDKKFVTVELEEPGPQLISSDLIPSLPTSLNQKKSIKKMSERSLPTYQSLPTIKPIAIDQKLINSDIFVKIEKFRAARRSLVDVSERLNEITEMLRKIREIRLREEQELSSWEKEVATAKAQIENVTQNIFEKIE